MVGTSDVLSVLGLLYMNEKRPLSEFVSTVGCGAGITGVGGGARQFIKASVQVLVGGFTGGGVIAGISVKYW